MTEPEPPPPDETPPSPPSGEPPSPERRRAVLTGFGAAILAVAAILLAPFLGNLGALWFFLPIVALAVVAYQRRGTGFGVGAAFGCGVALLIGGGACIALLMSFQQ